MRICFLTLTRGISVWVHLHRNGVHRNLWKYPKLSTFYPFLRNQEKKADGRPKKMWSDWISLGKVFPCSVPPQTNGETKLLALNIYPLVLVSFLGRTIALCRSLATPLVSKLHLALSTLGVGSFSIFDRRESPPWIDGPSWPFLVDPGWEKDVGFIAWLSLWNLPPNNSSWTNFIKSPTWEIWPSSARVIRKTHWGSMLHFNLCERSGLFDLQCDNLYWASLALQIGSIDTCLSVFSTARGNNDNTLIS